MNKTLRQRVADLENSVAMLQEENEKHKLCIALLMEEVGLQLEGEAINKAYESADEDSGPICPKTTCWLM